VNKDLINLVNTYKSVFSTLDGQKVLDDLRKFSGIDEQSGSALSHSECAYRNAMQDFYRYIEAVISEE
tara:strand:- start:81 stop:284 length:204 start_codon:yes stop_codon:yes gene_type:complete